MSKFLAAFALAIAWPLTCLAADAQTPTAPTSENSPRLKRLLERHPEADANNDGILTADEVRAASAKRQGGPPRRPPVPTPTKANVAYGPHKRNVLDFWQAESRLPTPLFVWIHGGGFRGGDKTSIPLALLQRCLAKGISCASINYRLTDTAPYPAQMHDGARAIQFLRSKASEWNLEPSHFAAGGGSAGSGISQWIAFHDDMAQPRSDDLVARQSTRLSCVLPLNMQSTYDVRDIKRLIPGKAYSDDALRPFYGLPAHWSLDTDGIDPALDALMKDASPINHLTKDDPPAYVLAYAAAETPGNIHHPNFARHLKQAMDKLGVECVLRLDNELESRVTAYDEMVEFLKKHLPSTP